MRLVSILAAVAAVGLTAPAFAQQVDESTRKQIEEQLAGPYRNAYDKQDAAGVAKLFAKDGVLVLSIGKHVYTGPQEIEQIFQSLFKAGFNHTEGAEEFSSLANDTVVAIGEYHNSGQGPNGPVKADGHYTAVDVREGGVWKFRLLTAFRDPPPPPPK